jgi:hypothetical protein
MKTTLIVSTICLLLSCLTFAQEDYSYLDNKKGTSMEPILAAADPLIKEIEDEGNEIVRMEFDLVFDEKTTYRDLYEGWTYGIAAFGDYRIKDIDITVYRKSGGRWDKDAQDAENDDVATVTIKPDKSEEYKIVISVYKFNKDYTVGHYGLVIYHE